MPSVADGPRSLFAAGGSGKQKNLLAQCQANDRYA